MRGTFRWAVVLAVGLELNGVVQPSHALAGGSGRALCTELDYRDLIKGAEETALPSGHLRVPVVVHLMDRSGEHAVKDAWTQQFDYLRTYFGTTGAFSVNGVWAQAGIRFDIVRVESCTYDRALPATDDDGNIRVPDPSMMRQENPAQQQERIDRYLEINILYGDARAVNIYVWPKLAQRIRGYGEAPRRNRIEVRERRLDAQSTVWYGQANIGCRDLDHVGRRCQLIFAHELGHALGLKHVCRACNGPPTPPPSCCTALCWQPRDYYSYASSTTTPGAMCFVPTPDGLGQCCCGCEPSDDVRDGMNACGQQPKCCDSTFTTSLMQVDATEGTEGMLCDAEAHSARSAVREFFPR